MKSAKYRKHYIVVADGRIISNPIKDKQFVKQVFNLICETVKPLSAHIQQLK